MAGNKNSGPGKGKTNNPNGRCKGSQNKVTTEIKTKIVQLFEGYSQTQMHEDLQSLEPVERLKVMTGLVNFIIPRINHNINEQTEPIVIKGITFDK